MSPTSTLAPSRRYTMTTNVPPEITTPDMVDTRVGRLEFFDGVPSTQTARALFDHLDFLRGVEVFLNGIPGVSMVALRAALANAGAAEGTIAIFEELMDSRSLYLTANTESLYFWSWIDLKRGPVVIETPPGMLGVVNDFWSRCVTDIGIAGPDEGRGGRFVLLPPDFIGTLPPDHFPSASATFGNLLVGRAFLGDGDPRPVADHLKKNLKIYPLNHTPGTCRTKFLNLSGSDINTVPPNTFAFYEHLNQIVQEEPAGTYGPDMGGLFASIGIVKGRPFRPDPRMRSLLTEAAAVGNATARAISFRNRTRGTRIYPDGQWTSLLAEGGSEWLENGVRNFDARTMFFYSATVSTPTMAMPAPGIGSQYATTNLDEAGNVLNGASTYRLRLPANIPAGDFWSVCLYDTQSRSMLQTNQPFPSLSSQRPFFANADGTVDIYFGPTPMRDTNWIQTIPGKSWLTMFRLYGPLQPWFDRTWRLPDIERIR